MAEPEGAVLLDVEDVGQGLGPAHLLEELGPARLLEHRLELRGRGEVVGDGPLPVRQHDADLGDACPGHLLDGVLDDGSVDDRQQHLGHRLGGGEEPGPETCGGDDPLANGHGQDLSPPLKAKLS